MKDTLAAVSIDPESGKMKIIGHYATGHHPRSFCIDLTGNFVFAGGQRSSNLVAYQLYEKLGFNEVGVRENYYPAYVGREDALILAKELL